LGRAEPGEQRKTLRLRLRDATVKRTLAAVIALAVLVPAVAVARRLATGTTRTAIERVAVPGFDGPQRCLIVAVTTKDGGNWATVGFNGADYRSCASWGLNGVYILHRARGRWRNVTSGSALIPCGRFGIPVAVRRDLALPCR
jgi:hypothetical protein